jgi:predicted transcriptional regulator
MKKLSRVKEYAARYLHKDCSMSFKEIAKELAVTEETVKNTLEIETKESPLKTVTSKTSDFINETSMKGTQSVMIMTEGASQQLDGISETHRSAPNTKYENVIRKARE